MSSKHAAANLNREIFLGILRVIESGRFSDFLESSEAAPRSWDRLRYMEHKNYIRSLGDAYVITPQGKKLLAEEDIWNLKIETPKKWDGKWHMVLFDIPVDKRKRRDIFRLRLKELGLVLYQNSVWVYPYPLEEVVRKVSTFYMLSKCVSFVVADSLSGEEKLRKHFKLK